MLLTELDLKLRIESDLHQLHSAHGWNSDQLDEFIAPVIDDIRELDEEEEEDEG